MRKMKITKITTTNLLRTPNFSLKSINDFNWRTTSHLWTTYRGVMTNMVFAVLMENVPLNSTASIAQKHFVRCA